MLQYRLSKKVGTTSSVEYEAAARPVKTDQQGQLERYDREYRCYVQLVIT